MKELEMQMNWKVKSLSCKNFQNVMKNVNYNKNLTFNII